jgi:hypothetical protein
VVIVTFIFCPLQKSRKSLFDTSFQPWVDSNLGSLDIESCVLPLDQRFLDWSITYTRNMIWRAIVKAVFKDNLLKVAICSINQYGGLTTVWVLTQK